MKEAKLGQRQVFGMLRKSLEKRVIQRFEQAKNAAEIVEFAVAILIRDALCVGDFSYMFPEVIREIFLTAEPNDTLRRHCVYFQNYFTTKGEWQKVIDRLFKSEKEFRAFTKETCLYKALLEKKARETSAESEFRFDLVTVFKDANGKRYTWTLRDTKQVAKNLASETAEVLQILTTLTIFQASGVRRFAEYVKFKSTKSCVDAEHEADLAEPAEESVQASIVENKRDVKANPRQKQVAPAAKITADSHQKTVDQVAARSEKQKDGPKNRARADSKANSLAVKANSPTKEAKAPPQKLDTSALRYGKPAEQIEQAQDDKKWNNRVKEFFAKIM